MLQWFVAVENKFYPFLRCLWIRSVYCGDDRIHNGKCFPIKLNQTCLQFGYFQQRLQQCFQSVQCTPAADAKFLLLRLTQIVPQQYAKAGIQGCNRGFQLMGNVGYHFLCAFLLRSGFLLQQLDMMSDRFKLKFQSFLPDMIFCVRHYLKVIFPKCNQDLL